MLTIDEIKKAVSQVGRKYNIRSAYLFGSYAKNLADEHSDIDLYVDSGLTGLHFVGFVESIRQALGEREVDIIDKTHVSKNSKVMTEINETGVLVYAR